MKTALSVEDFNVKNVLLTEDFTENGANPLMLTCVMRLQANLSTCKNEIKLFYNYFVTRTMRSSKSIHFTGGFQELQQPLAETGHLFPFYNSPNNQRDRHEDEHDPYRLYPGDHQVIAV